MIDLESFTEKHIREIKKTTGRDPALIERLIYAFGLLEAITRSGLPFIFKGGSALILLMEKPRRLSTDIDIVCEPGMDIDGYLAQAAVIWPFVKITEHIREKQSGIEKRHFKFSYTSPLAGNDRTIILDVLFEKNPYRTVISKNIENELLITTFPTISVHIPNADCLLADKLAAFAPHTTGIPFHK